VNYQSITYLTAFQMGSVFSELSWELDAQVETSLFYNGSLKIFRTPAHLISVYGFCPVKTCKKWLKTEELPKLTVFCWLYVIEKVGTEAERLRIRTEFLPLIPVDCGGADGDEAWEGIFFKDAEHILHVGTEDGQGLFYRAMRDEWMPKRFESYFKGESQYKGVHSFGRRRNTFTDDAANGFITNVPVLQAGEKICFQHLAAEQNDGDEFNSDSGHATDLPLSWLLEELGIAPS
jgi:hypothetical protein